MVAFRRTLVGVIAVAGTLTFLGMYVAFEFSRGALYYGLALGGDAPYLGALSGRLGTLYETIRPLRGMLFLVGFLAMLVLAGSFVLFGKASLHRRSSVWWVLLGLLGISILAGIGGMYLPFVDARSNTEAFFERIGNTQYGAVALLFPIVALFFERGIPLAAAADGGWKRLAPRVPMLAAVVLGVLAVMAQMAGGYQTRRPGSAYWSLERAVCGSTHVLVGTPRDFERVREPYCMEYDDRRPEEGSNVLGRCESLQFKVDVVEQIWPLPATTLSFERTSTFRQSGVRGDFDGLVRDLAVINDGTGYPRQGPRVFYARASQESGGTVFANSSREGIMVTEVPRNVAPRDAGSLISRCSQRHAQAAEVRRACNWDYAFVGVAKSFRLAPPDGRPAYEFHAFDEGRETPDVHALDSEMLKRGDVVEVGLEVLENLDPVAGPMPARQFFVRVSAGQPVQFRLMRNAWYSGKVAVRHALFVRQDAAEAELLHPVAQWEEYRPGKARFQKCLEQRAALEGKTVPPLAPEPPTASEKYRALWLDASAQALSGVCAARSGRVDSLQVETQVMPDGKVAKVRISKPSRNPKFDAAVVAALGRVAMPAMPREVVPAELRERRHMFSYLFTDAFEPKRFGCGW